MPEPQIDRRPWQCPGCTQTYRIPADALDPDICKFCREESDKETVQDEEFRKDTVRDTRESAKLLMNLRIPSVAVWLFVVPIGLFLLILVMGNLMRSSHSIRDSQQLTAKLEEELTESILEHHDRRSEEIVEGANRTNTDSNGFHPSERPVQRALPGETPAGSGFFWKNMSAKAEPYLKNTCEVIGEMTNRSGTSYGLVSFTLSAYGQNGELLETATIHISTFAHGNTKSFQTYLLRTDRSRISTVKIQFDNGI